jgi:hypothetical protein
LTIIDPSQRHPREAAGHDPDLVAEHGERAQVDVARRQAAPADLGGRRREMDQFLGDEAVGLVLDHPRLGIALRLRGVRADEHALAP